MTEEQNSYILGTEKKELHRLGFQHQVWAKEARKAWEIAEFSKGQTILDLGCGPGFCTMDLGYIVGTEGKIIGVDKSNIYINFLTQQAQLHGLNISLQNCDFDEMVLKDNSLDGVFSRWALCWIPNPEEVIQKISKALKSGGAFVAHEYYDWSTIQTEPHMPALDKGIKMALKSFKDSEGEIDIGRKLPSMFYDAGLEIVSSRPMSIIASPDHLSWHWPKTFFEIYFPKLVDMGFLKLEELELALEELEDLEYINGASIFCPQMIEHVAVKI